MSQIFRITVLIFLLLGATVSSAEWMGPTNAPVERLIKNYTEKLKKNPKDAHAAYVLARIHSLAYATKAKTVGVYESTTRPLSFAPWKSLQVAPKTLYASLDNETKEHLRESVRLYALAFKLDPKTPIHTLGYGWMLEQAANYADEIGAVKGVFEKAQPRSAWLRSSLAAYRKGYKEFLEADISGPSRMFEVEDAFVSQECALGIIRIVERGGVALFGRGERASLISSIEKLKGKRMGITPIIFPVDHSGSLVDLINPNARSQFDLVGDGIGREWPWVRPSAAFLVWDPKKSGVVKSGRQLFGSATFWMFFNDGYEALASLDNNGDGWLRGEELKGIAVWRDLDSDGVSDKGEVLPVNEWRIEAINVRHDSTELGALRASTGIVFQGGSTVPTYDWEPVSIVEKQPDSSNIREGDMSRRLRHEH